MSMLTAMEFLRDDVFKMVALASAALAQHRNSPDEVISTADDYLLWLLRGR